jgi:hypothetical protein
MRLFDALLEAHALERPVVDLLGRVSDSRSTAREDNARRAVHRVAELLAKRLRGASLRLGPATGWICTMRWSRDEAGVRRYGILLAPWKREVALAACEEWSAARAHSLRLHGLLWNGAFDAGEDVTVGRVVESHEVATRIPPLLRSVLDRTAEGAAERRR